MAGETTGPVRNTAVRRQESARLPRDVRLAALAARQHGVVATRQLGDLGLSASGIHHRVRAGRLHRVHHGVYAVGHPVLTRSGRWSAALLACGPGAVLSHRTAAASWDLRPQTGGPIELTVPARGSRRRPGLRIHCRSAIGPHEVVTRDGLATTSMARTLVDLAEVVTEAQLRRALARADLLGALDVHALHAAGGRRGGALLRRVLATYAPDEARTRSELESLMLGLISAHDLPRPRLNAIVLDRFEADFVWPAQQVVVETDGFAAHTTRASFAADRVRDRALQAAGYRVLRFTFAEVDRAPAAVADEIRAALSGGSDGGA